MHRDLDGLAERVCGAVRMKWARGRLRRLLDDGAWVR